MIGATSGIYKMSVKSVFLGSAAMACVLSVVPAHAQDDDDTIIVTGSPLVQNADDTLVGVSVLSGEELSKRLAGTIGETLKSEPGISSTFFGAGASRPIIRGQGGDRIRVLDNGIGSIDASAASPDHAVAVEPAMAERIEVIRGSGLLRYGSSAAGGVINVIDGRIPTDAPEDGLDGTIRVGTTTVDDGVELAAGFDMLVSDTADGQLVFHLDGTWADRSDYDIPDFAESAILRASEEEEEHDDDHDHEEEEEIRDTLENSFAESSSIAAGLSWITSKGFIGFSAKKFETEYGVPGGHGHGHEEEHDGDEDHDEEHEEEEEENVFISLDQTRYDVNGQYLFDGSAFESINIYAGYADYEHIEFEGPGEVGTVFTNEGWEARVELIQRPTDGWQAAYGIQLRDREFSAIGEEAFVPPTTSDQIGIYTFQEFESGDWHFEAAARYEQTNHQNDVTGVERDFDGFSVSAGADFHVSENFRIGGAVFRTERAPTTEELFSNGPHLATDQFEVGNVDLDEEIGVGAEAVVRFSTDTFNATVNLFQTSYDGYIYEVATGEEEDELPVFQFTSEDAVFKGLEIAAGQDLGVFNGMNLSADAVLEIVEAELDVEGNDNLPRIPPYGLLVGLEAEGDRFSVRGEIDHAAEQDSISQFELPTDSYTQLNLITSFRPLPQNDNVVVRVSALNLTDEDARQHTSFLKDMAPLPGRNFRISLETSF